MRNRLNVIVISLKVFGLVSCSNVFLQENVNQQAYELDLKKMVDRQEIKPKEAFQMRMFIHQRLIEGDSLTGVTYKQILFQIEQHSTP